VRQNQLFSHYYRCIDKRERVRSNNRFNLTNPLARLCAFAQTAPSPAGTDLQVKRMLHSPAGGKDRMGQAHAKKTKIARQAREE